MARTPESDTLNFASKSNQVEDASQTQISNQYAAKGGSQTEITQEVAGDNIGQTEISNQKAAEEVTGSDIRHMDASFYKAAAEGNMNILRDMSQEDMRDKLTPKKNTILHVAAQFGQLHCVNWILDRLPSSSPPLQQRNLKRDTHPLQQRNLKGDTPLHLAAREGHQRVTKALIQAAKALPSESEIGADKMMLRMTNKENDTALHEAVRYNHPDVVKSLILEDPGCRYSANSSGGTPLYMAAERGFHELVQIIIDNTTRDSLAYSGLMGRTALHAAVICNNKDMTKKILGWEKGLTKEVDDNRWSPLHCAAYLGYTSIARQLLEKSDKCVVYLRVKNDHNKTALHIAASCGHTEIVKLLVSQYPDCCEQVDDNGNNALHLIMIKMGISGDSGLLNFPWMSFRGLMNEKNDKGKTPLHLLADHQMFHCGHFIMHKMVDKMVLDNENSTPMDIMLSAEDKHGEKVPILKRLRSAKARRGPLGWQKVIEEGIEGRRRKEAEKVSKMKKAAKIHMLVAMLVATVIYETGFQLPDVYDEMNGKDIILAPPPNGYEDIRWDKQVQIAFDALYGADVVAFACSIIAIAIYFGMWLWPSNNVHIVRGIVFVGFFFTYIGLLAMFHAFLYGLSAGLARYTFKQQ